MGCFLYFLLFWVYIFPLFFSFAGVSPFLNDGVWPLIALAVGGIGWLLFCVKLSGYPLKLLRDAAQFRNVLENGTRVEAEVVRKIARGQTDEGSEVSSIVFAFNNFSGARVAAEDMITDSKPQEKRFEPGKKFILRLNPNGSYPVFAVDGSRVRINRKVLRGGLFQVVFAALYSIGYLLVSRFVFGVDSDAVTAELAGILQGNEEFFREAMGSTAAAILYGEAPGTISALADKWNIRFLSLFYPWVWAPFLGVFMLGMDDSSRVFGSREKRSIENANIYVQLLLYGKRTEGEIVRMGEFNRNATRKQYVTLEVRYTNDRGEQHLKEVSKLIKSSHIARAEYLQVGGTVQVFYLPDNQQKIYIGDENMVFRQKK